MIKIRQQYLKQLVESKDTEFIKVLTGVRLSGKSFILDMFRDYLISTGVEQNRIIYINFEHPDTDDIKNYKTLNEYLKSKADRSGKYYFMFDEIQEVENWQRCRLLGADQERL